MPFLLTLQKFFAVNRTIITNAFIVVELAIMVGWFLIYFQALNNYPSIVRLLFEYGALLGQLSLIFYCITLIPGIITRLQWFPTITRPIGAIIMLFRRHFGILMFLSAFWHMTFTTYIPYYARFNFAPPSLPPLADFQLMGLTAWLLLFPLWLTSNDYSKKMLGRGWKVLHKLTYIALFFIFLHVAMQRSNWMYVMGTFVVLMIISWLVDWRRKATTPAQPVQPVAQVQTPTPPTMTKIN